MDAISSAEGNRNAPKGVESLEWPHPANTSMPLLITGGVVSLLVAVAVVADAAAVLASIDWVPLVAGPTEDGDGDFPLLGVSCVGEVLVGERLDIDAGLLLLPSLALVPPCS